MNLLDDWSIYTIRKIVNKKISFLDICGFPLLKQEVANRIRKVIENKFDGVDLRLARAAKIHPPTLQKYIEAKSIPGGDKLIKLAKAAGVSIDWLLTGQEAEPAKEGDIVRPDEKDFLVIARKLSKEGKNSWNAMGTYLLEKELKEGVAPPISESAGKKKEKPSKSTS